MEIIGEAVKRCVLQSIANMAEIAANIWLLPVKLIVSGSCGCQEWRPHNTSHALREKREREREKSSLMDGGPISPSI